ncbi:MAG: NAD(P)/FAD-dependent oxidoreductase [Treponema sp.]|jgi:flavin-dependent dehydrogenase|nr:NAD(P)/FAD-dependent oxidoreductase [Treponema sp.]
MANTTDILIIGGGPAGMYFAYLMAKQGYHVIVCDSSPEKSIGASYDIVHIGREHFKRFGLPEPEPEDSEYVALCTLSILRSALNHYPKRNRVPILVLRRGIFMQRLLGLAKKEGAEVQAAASFKEPLFNREGKLAGAVVSDKYGNISSINARLTVDASGIPAVVRTSLPPGAGIETFKTGTHDQFYVILRYVKLKDPEKDTVTITTTWTHYKVWLAPQHAEGGAIIGVGAYLSFDYAEQCFQKFAAKGFLPDYELDHIEQGSTPYRRPPYSFVTDGFLALGSAACISNPWSGEGIPYSWLLNSIAAHVCAAALQNGAYPTREALWQINVQYMREQGALFAKNLALLSGATTGSEEENEYEYKHSIIYENAGESGNLVLKLLRAAVFGGISMKTLHTLISAARIGDTIYRHYQAYPEHPRNIALWTVQAERLWKKAQSIADHAEKDTNG